VRIEIDGNRQEMGAAAAAFGAERVRRGIRDRGAAVIVLATGASQFEMLEHLVAAPDIDWGRVTAFHLDEYVGLPEGHPASFRRYLQTRFVDQLPTPIGRFHFIDGDADPEAERRRLVGLIEPVAIDVAFVGIGENGHLAFNDPPADFTTTDPYLVVTLDDACRRQQLGEGWFETFEDVPQRAISMSVRQILTARTVVCTVPDARKAEAVRRSLEGPVTEEVPASALQLHSDCHVFLDVAGASLLAATARR
jgi:glucosamine-6-phosphate deaminase